MKRVAFLLDIDWSFFDREYMGEKVSNFLLFAGIVLATLLLKKPVAALLTRVGSGLAARLSYIEHKSAIRDILAKPVERLLQVVLFYVAVNQLDGFLENFVFHRSLGKTGKVHITLADVVDHVFLLLFIVFLTLLVSRIIDFAYYYRMQHAHKEKNNSRMQLLPLIKEMSKLILWIISCFWILGWVFGINIPALITGLGIGGLAIALAGKETVENFFAAFTILSDRPFQTGDIIKVGETEAVVERIGFRSTRLRNTDGSAFIIPNQSLVSQNLTNLSTRDRRGIKVISHIRHGISYEQLTHISEELRAAVLAVPGVKEPVVISVDAYEKETFQLAVNYDLPHPLPDSLSLVQIKRDVNLKIYEVVSANAKLGTPVGTS